MDETSQLTFNGIDGSTGEYLQQPLPVEQVSRLVRGERIDESHLADLKWRRHKETEEHFAPVEGVDPKDLSQTGWGVVFPHDADPAIREALRPLLDLRRRQAAAKNERLYREFTGPDAYRPDEAKPAFLNRHGAGGAGAVDPTKVPYYLLLVGSPEAIPFRFQYQLDVQYAVGRVHFETIEEYVRYAESVVNAETGKVALPRKAAFFGVANSDDMATGLSSKHLVKPLADYVSGDQPCWSVDFCPPAQAHKNQLATLLGGSQTPAFLFTASHGMGFPNGHARQFAHTGALVCQDWPGPRWKGAFTPDFYFAANDLADSARVAGLIAMFFACYGGGSPKLDDFAVSAGSAERKILAPNAFVSALPNRLLAHPKGGALAVVAHVDRAWGYSFYWSRSERQLQVFQSSLKRLLEGHPVGSALEYFNSRYAELSADLSSELEEIQFGKKPNDLELCGMWTSNNDARNYTVIGDPAVRITTMDESTERKPLSEGPIVVTSSGPAPAPSAPPPVAEFGLFDSLRETQDKLSSTVHQILQKLGASIERTLDNVSTLEVNTYTCSEADNVAFENGRFQGARLRAATRVTLTGDTQSCVPLGGDGRPDEAIWRLHAEMVARAQEHRTMIWKAASEMAAQLFGGIKR
jgi:hypothetical protein